MAKAKKAFFFSNFSSNLRFFVSSFLKVTQQPNARRSAMLKFGAWGTCGASNKKVRVDNIGLVQDQINFLLFPLGPVPERPNSVNPGLKFCFVFVFYILMHCLGWHCVLSLPFLVVKDQQYFVTSSCMFLDEKSVLEILLNPCLG